MRPLLLHGHIFKNAGSTLDWALARSLARGFVACPDEQAMREYPEAYLCEYIEANPGLLALSSHVMPLEVPLPAGVRPLRVYLLRHPLLRISSVYAFERRQVAATPGAEAAKAMEFSEYVAWRMRPEVRPVVRDYQTRYLSGLHTAAPDRVLQPADMQRALQTLSQTAWVGVVEYFDQSMVLLEQYLRPFFPALDLAYVAQNVSALPACAAGAQAASMASGYESQRAAAVAGVGNDRPGSQSPAAVLGALGVLAEMVLHNNRCDLALHAMAVAQLGARCAAHPRFDSLLADFRARCQHLQEHS